MLGLALGGFGARAALAIAAAAAAAGALLAARTRELEPGAEAADPEGRARQA